METVTYVLSAIVITVVAGTAGKFLGNNNKITNIHCTERQKSCQGLLFEKIENIVHRLDALTIATNKAFPRKKDD